MSKLDKFLVVGVWLSVAAAFQTYIDLFWWLRR